MKDNPIPIVVAMTTSQKNVLVRLHALQRRRVDRDRLGDVGPCQVREASDAEADRQDEHEVRERENPSMLFAEGLDALPQVLERGRIRAHAFVENCRTAREEE